MPETAIHEYREFLRAEDEIGFAGQRYSASPADNVILTHQCDEPKFSGIVSLPADTRHSF